MFWDLATVCGVAYGRVGETPRATTIDLGRDGSGEPAKFAAMLSGSAKLLLECRPDVLAFEAPLAGAKRDYFLGGLAAILQGQAHILGLRAISINRASILKHWLGKALGARDFPEFAHHKEGQRKALARQRIKGLVIARCGVHGWNCHGSDDEADALAGWSFACSTLAGGAPIGPPPGGLFDGVAR